MLVLIWLLAAITSLYAPWPTIAISLETSLYSQVPSVAIFKPTKGTFQLASDVRIIVDSLHGTDGSPSAYAFAETFRTDLMSLAGFRFVPPVLLSPGDSGTKDAPAIVIEIDPNLQYSLYNAKPTDEGYDFEITEYTYTIKASAPIGVWWGTRSLLQQAVSAMAADSKVVAFSTGKGTDAPGWEVRGFMLDAGRHWFDTGFLSELCIYASFFKINEMHLHSSDNLWNPDFLYGTGNEGWKELYAAFRFQPPHGSPISGLVPRLNESWTQSDFSALQETCTNHGVTIIPEIDNPGHSLIFSQWKPELMLSGSPDSLNLSYPDTIPTIKSVWEEFLPWFTSSEVSIGADEYDASLADDYISFVNEMSDYIMEQSSKSVRIWGTNEPSDTLSVSKQITIQHWDFPDADIPIQLMNEGYYVINSEQYFLYLDGKFSDGDEFPQQLSPDLIWSGAPGGTGWAPNIFSPTDASNNTQVDDPMLRGAIMALWSDWGNNATTMLEDYYQLAPSLALFAEKAWAGSGVRDTELTRSQFEAVYPVLNAAAPGQNLNRVVKPERGNTIYEYAGSYNLLRTPYTSVGPPYTLTFSVKPDATHPTQGLLFSGRDSKLWVANLTFEATGQLYALGYVLPTDAYTTVSIHATTGYTYAIIDGDEDHPYYWYTIMDIWGEYLTVGNMSFAAPSRQIGGEAFGGLVKDISLVLGV
ncbi:glycoside hydrolase family 20 protein [Gelatoporia subvermispora B]|uniref:beta-N-acetylhexosaminidase n=1 Tax=Ceriporiopsis subvermispora (strain B) TaxID=914234 RepID=M2PZI6_CERS8|nr:glycoside hydrolase family 20 protein [Gelatoporia subvermispora B]